MPPWRLQQLPAEADRRPAIAPGLHQDVEGVAVFVHGQPELVELPLTLDEHFVREPGVALASSTATERSGTLEAELLAPPPNRLVGDDDGWFGEQIFDVTEIQIEAVIDPHCG